MSNIDLGDTPTGTPPTVGEKIQILSVLGASPVSGSLSIVTLGTVTTGTWNGAAISDSYIASASTWNAKQSAITFGANVQNALAVSIGSAGAPVLLNGVGGIPSSIDLTNGTNIPAGNLTGNVAAARITTALTTAQPISATTLSASGVLTISAGTVGAPGLSFSGDSNTGMYSPFADGMYFVTAGTSRFEIGSYCVFNTIVRLTGTTAASPALQGTSDINTGIYWPNSDVLGVATNGLARWTINASGDLTGDSTNGGKLVSNSIVRTRGYTVATLPAGATGDRAYVTDALAPAYAMALTGGGAITVPVFYNGTTWISA